MQHPTSSYRWGLQVGVEGSQEEPARKLEKISFASAEN